MKKLTLLIDEDGNIKLGLEALETLLVTVKSSITIAKRIEGKGKAKVSNAVSKKFNYLAELKKLVSDEDLIAGYLEVGRITKRAKTKIGLNSFKKECDRHNVAYDKAMFIVIDKNWRGFTYSWLKDEDFEKYELKKKIVAKPKKEKPVTMNEAKKIISDNEKVEITKQQINAAYLNYMDLQEMPDFASMKFDFLVDQHKIFINEKTRKYFIDKRETAIQELLNDFDPEKALNVEDKNARKIMTKYIKEDSSPKIDIRVKEIVLKEFFEKQISLDAKKIFQ